MGKQVMVVDDDEDVREILGDYLTLKGYAVSMAENGQQALDILEGLPEKPCFLLLDLMMPVMDGWQFLRQIEPDNDLSSIPVFVTTSAPERAPKGYPLLPKPVDLHQVARAVQSVCNDSTD